ncbi:MAG: hypothetical protein R3F54_28680 [Alphaproteobacteria bacterium]
MPIGKKTTEVDPGAGLAMDDEIIANVNRGTARVPVADIPELRHGIVFWTGPNSFNLTEAAHFHRHINVNNANGAVVINLPDSEDVLIDQEDLDGDNVDRGGLFCTFSIASGNNPVSFVATLSDNLRASGNPFQSAFGADTVYVGAKASIADEATVCLYKRGGLWVAHCSHGWRTTEDGDELAIPGTAIGKNIMVTGASNWNITDSDHERTLWLTATSPGTLTFDEELSEGLTFSIVNAGGNPATFDFTGHTQVGDTNSIAEGEAGTLVVGPITSGTSRSIILKSSS